MTTLAPVTGAAGTLVTITGTNFLGATRVTFNTTPATVFTVVSATSIKAVVPAGTTSGTIKVTGPGGTGTSTASFTTPPPAITRFTPTSGIVGATVTIIGANLTGATAVTLNGVAATITSITATSLRFVIPIGASTGLIKVTTAAGAETSSTSFTVPAPTVTSFTPTSALVGAAVTIVGTNFLGATSVKFNGVLALIVSNTTTSISARIPAGATTGRIRVTTGAVTGTLSAPKGLPDFVTLHGHRFIDHHL